MSGSLCTTNISNIVGDYIFFLFTEHSAVTEPGVISQDAYLSDICQAVGTFLCMVFQKMLRAAITVCL